MTTKTSKAKIRPRPLSTRRGALPVVFEAERGQRRRRLFLFSVTLGSLEQDGSDPGRPHSEGVYRGLAAHAEEALAFTLAARVKEDAARVKEDAGRRHVGALWAVNGRWGASPKSAGREAFERLGLVVLNLTCHGTADWVHVRTWGRA